MAGAVFVAFVHVKIAVDDLPTDIDERISSALSADPESRGLIERPIGGDLNIVAVNSNLGGKAIVGNGERCRHTVRRSTADYARPHRIDDHRLPYARLA